MMSSDDNNAMMSTPLPSMPYQADSLERLQKVAYIPHLNQNSSFITSIYSFQIMNTYRRLTAITSYLQKQRAEIIEQNFFILKISG